MTNEADTVKVELPEAFITCTSANPDYFVTIKTKTLRDAHFWHDAVIDLGRRLPHEAEGKAAPQAVRERVIEECAQAAEDVPRQVIWHNGLGYAETAPATNKEAAAAIRALSASPSSFPDPGVAATHRHKGNGDEYTLIGYGKMQAEDWHDLTVEPTVGGDGYYCTHHPDDPAHDLGCYALPSVDMREVAIYRSVDDGSLWVRPREEFEDGRFEAIALSQGRAVAMGDKGWRNFHDPYRHHKDTPYQHKRIWVWRPEWTNGPQALSPHDLNPAMNVIGLKWKPYDGHDAETLEPSP